MRNVVVISSVVVIAALVGCGKARETASEKAAERMIESAMEKDGTKARVNLSEGGAKITTTDASGKTTQMEMGTAKITETDVGVPFYPGAKVLVDQSTRISTPDGSSVSVSLQSSDAPDKVGGFYRERLKAQAEGKQFMDMSSADGGAMLQLMDEKTDSAIQVALGKAENGTEIRIVAHRRAAK